MMPYSYVRVLLYFQLRRSGSQLQQQYQYSRVVVYCYIILQGSPSGCGRREIPGVSQVGKGNAGKRAMWFFLIVAEKSAGVLQLYCEREEKQSARIPTYGSQGIHQVPGLRLGSTAVQHKGKRSYQGKIVSFVQHKSASVKYARIRVAKV